MQKIFQPHSRAGSGIVALKHDAYWRFTLFGVVIGLVALCLAAIRPPAPQPIHAPAGEFSATRAYDHLTILAAAPRPAGTEGHAAAADYIVEQIRKLDLRPERQEGLVVSSKSTTAGHIENILVRIPGKRPGPALLVVAHYDSVAGSPGAADNGASLAAALEMLRALKEAPPALNDLIVLFTDGEETDLLGARLFASDARSMRQIGLVLNFEYRGAGGPVWMFETSEHNGAIIAEWSKAVRYPLGNSLLYEVYKHMPNDTDLTVFKESGAPALNFAAGEQYNSYHTQIDSIERLDLGSLQQQGDIMLAMVRHFGEFPLASLKANDRVYFNFPLIGLLHYPVSYVMPIGIVCALLFVAVALQSVRTRTSAPHRIAVAMAVFAINSALIALACQFLWNLVLEIHPGYKLLLHGSTYNGNWYLAGFCALGLGMYALAWMPWRRYLNPAEVTLGVLGVMVLLLLVTSYGLPGASYLFASPLLVAIVGFAILQSRPGRRLSGLRQTAVLVIMAFPAIALFAPLIHLLYVALTPEMLQVSMLMLMLFLGMMSSAVQAMQHRFLVPLVPIVAGAVLVAAGSMTANFTERHPRPNHLLYLQDSGSGKAYWISEDLALDEWTSLFFPGPDRRRQITPLLGPGSPPVWLAMADSLPYPPPLVRKVDEWIEGSKRHLRLEILSQRAAPALQVCVDGTPVDKAWLQGKPLTSETTHNWQFAGYGFKNSSVELKLELAAGQAFAVRVQDISYDLPAHRHAMRPPHMMAEPFGSSDTTRIVSAMRFPASMSD